MSKHLKTSYLPSQYPTLPPRFHRPPEGQSLPPQPSKPPEKRTCNGDSSFSKVEVYQDQRLGNGAYGMVCRARVDDLMCAAKIIHRTLLPDAIDDDNRRIVEQFEKECEILNTTRHPCIVQYIGRYHITSDPLPVLLIELMDESLTKLLERSLAAGEHVSLHTQTNIAHDVALALSFLHSKGIVHRDLSSNNVLLIAGSRAKVADFGMAKLFDSNPRRTPLTQCPGTMVYMAPEALRSNPKYTDKLDVFSLGVLLIQIVTRLFPSPTEARRTIQDPRYPHPIEAPVPELKRRTGDLEKVPEDHLLRPLALSCIADEDLSRPSSSEVCQELKELKKSAAYETSLTESTQRPQIHALKEHITELEKRLATEKSKIETLINFYEREHLLMQEKLKNKDTEILKLRLEMGALNRRGSNTSDDYLNIGSSCAFTPDPERSKSLEKMLDLEAPPHTQWFHGRISREQAEKLLHEVGSTGGYLIRYSQSEQNRIVLSYLDFSRKAHHFGINVRAGQRVDIGGSISFSSLCSLVGFHTRYSYIIKDATERLEVPVSPKVAYYPSEEQQWMFTQLAAHKASPLVI